MTVAGAEAGERVAVSARSRTAGAILRTLLDHGALARTMLARETGVSPATVTAHVAELMERGLVAELAPSAIGSVGRPHVPVDLATEAVVGGVHIGLLETTTALLDLRARVIVERVEPHAGASPAQIVRRAARRLTELQQGEAGRPGLLGVGVATGGWVDGDTGVVAEHPMLGWRDVPIVEQLESDLGVPVRVDSHARSLARAEQLFGVARSRRSVLALFVGNVVDAGYALGEEMQLGPRSRAGTVAHLPVPGSDVYCGCGRTGCLEATVSERRFLRLAHERGVAGTRCLTDVAITAADGDAVATGLLFERAALVGRAAALLVDLFNPEVVVVLEDGLLVLDGSLEVLRKEFVAHARSHRDPGVVIGSSFVESPLATTGGAAILDRLYRDPLSF